MFLLKFDEPGALRIFDPIDGHGPGEGGQVRPHCDRVQRNLGAEVCAIDIPGCGGVRDAAHGRGETIECIRKLFLSNTLPEWNALVPSTIPSVQGLRFM